jgi:putative transposase
MKKSNFTESKIKKALKEYEGGRSVQNICRELDVKPPTFYVWKRKYLGIYSDTLRRLKKFERENTQHKRMFADLSLDHRILKDVIERNL